MIEIIRVTSENKNFQDLIRELDVELNLRYGLLQNQYNQYNVIKDLNTVVVAYINKKAAGCGCFKELDPTTVELKRMLVKSEQRGSGIAQLIITELEQWAVEKGYSKMVLETGIKQPDAIRFYSKQGYVVIPNYGQYMDNDNSICMSKDLQK